MISFEVKSKSDIVTALICIPCHYYHLFQNVCWDVSWHDNNSPHLAFMSVCLPVLWLTDLLPSCLCTWPCSCTLWPCTLHLWPLLCSPTLLLPQLSSLSWTRRPLPGTNRRYRFLSSVLSVVCAALSPHLGGFYSLRFACTLDQRMVFIFL